MHMRTGFVTLFIILELHNKQVKRFVFFTAMSWLREAFGGTTGPINTNEGPQAAPANDTDPRVPDPYIPNRMVSTKKANRPFLAYAGS